MLSKQTFQNSLPFSPAKGCLLLLVQQVALPFFHYPHPLVMVQVAVIGTFSPASLEKQANVWFIQHIFHTGELPDWF